MNVTELRRALEPVMCCGAPELIAAKLMVLLEILDDRGKEASREKWAQTDLALLGLLGPSSNADFWLWLHVLDFLGLTEHGSMIAGSWLTQTGCDVLDALRKHGTDPQRWAATAV